MRMVYCEYCGTKLDDEVTSCPNCGAPVTKTETVYETQKEEAEETVYEEESTSDGWDTAATVAGVLLGSLLMPTPRRHVAPRRQPVPPRRTPSAPHHSGRPVAPPRNVRPAAMRGSMGPMGGPGGRPGSSPRGGRPGGGSRRGPGDPRR